MRLKKKMYILACKQFVIKVKQINFNPYLDTFFLWTLPTEEIKAWRAVCPLFYIDFC